MSKNILSIEHLNKSFGSLKILRDVNIDMAPGDFLVLVGPSGCGKSTLLNCIAGLEEVTSGAIRIGGRDMVGVPPRDRDIAMVFQSYALYPTMSVAKNITFSMKVRRVDPAVQKKKLEEVASLLQISELLDRKPGQLSGGQRQRVAMGRALVRDPQLFLFDEPLSNLDAKLRVEMRTEIKRLHRSLDASIVYVTHDQIEAMTLATKIAVMKGGEIQQIGTPEEIYTRPANMFVADFMGSPSMNLIPAKVQNIREGARIEIDTGDQRPLILVDPRRIGKLGEGGEASVVVGLRPEDITNPENREGEAIQVASCLVDVVEPAGSDTYLVTRLGGRNVTARMRADTRVGAGDMADLAFDLAKASYFLPDTGERLN